MFKKPLLRVALLLFLLGLFCIFAAAADQPPALTCGVGELKELPTLAAYDETELIFDRRGVNKTG